MTYARLRFSNVVTAEIATEAIDFLSKMYRDPRDAACFEIARYLQENPNMPYDFSDLINRASDVNPFVEVYLGPSPVNINSSKYRDIADRFKQGLVGNGFIFIEKENPLRLCFKPEHGTGAKTKGEPIEKSQQQQHQQQQQEEISPEELQKMPVPDSIERLGHSDLFTCKNKNCSKRGDIWEMKKHALCYCKSDIKSKSSG
jgi:hypothetical protein